MCRGLRLGIHFQAGYGFYVKLTPMSSAKPLRLESNNQAVLSIYSKRLEAIQT
jgi:hypothetical protein